MHTPLQQLYRHFLENPEVTTDSRKISPGSIFFALKGEHFDGNHFALVSIEQGAAFAVVDDPTLPAHPQLLLVDSVLLTLQELAAHHRSLFSIPVVAITGTNGKTTTKELTQAILSKKFKTIATSGNLNNHIGVPLTLLRIGQDTEIAVIEMGANHPGEIDLLCRIAAPGSGLITNIGKAHLEGFGGFGGVIRTKTEMYRYLAKHGGMVFLHGADPLLREYASGISTFTYGPPPANLELVESTADPYVSATISASGVAFALQSNLYGHYNLPNILAAAAIGLHFGVGPDEISAAIADYIPVNNRSQVRKSERNTLILDAYNANPSSMEVALESFASSEYENKMVILGDMLELGEAADEEHNSIIGQLIKHGFDQVYLVGPVFTKVNTRRQFTCFADSELARMWFSHHQPEGCSILVKGSRGIRLERISEIL